MVDIKFFNRCLKLCFAVILIFPACAFSKAMAADLGLLKTLQHQATKSPGEVNEPRPPAPPQPIAPFVSQPVQPVEPRARPARQSEPFSAHSGELDPSFNQQLVPFLKPKSYPEGHVGIPSPIDGFWFSMSPSGGVTLGLKNGVFMLLAANQQLQGQGTFQIDGHQIFSTTGGGQAHIYDFHHSGLNLTLRDRRTGTVVIYQRMPGARAYGGSGLMP